MNGLFIQRSKIVSASRCFTILLCLIGVASSFPKVVNGQDIQPISARVVNVADGDTLIVSVDHRAVIVELSGVVCPAIDEEGGVDAKRYTQRMVLNRKVSILPVGRQQTGRMAGIIFVNEHCLNDELVKHGLGEQSAHQ